MATANVAQVVRLPVHFAANRIPCGGGNHAADIGVPTGGRNQINEQPAPWLSWVRRSGKCSRLEKFVESRGIRPIGHVPLFCGGIPMGTKFFHFVFFLK